MNDLYFEFLDDLRDGGTMNMMGAPRELENEFGLNKIQARSVFQLWCLNFESAVDQSGQVIRAVKGVRL